MSRTTAAETTEPIRIGPGALVVMVGGIASGKTTYAKRIATEILGDPNAVIEADGIRATLFGDAAKQGDPARIHGLGHEMARIRLEAGLPVVYDATNLLARDRAGLIALAKETGAPLVAAWVEASIEEMAARNAIRERVVPDQVVAKMAARAAQVRQADLEKEGFTVIHIPAGGDLGAVEAVPSGWNNQTLRGPFDIIGDIHGCIHTLEALMAKLGYSEDGSHPEGRQLVSVGDIVDRGRHTWDTWTYVSGLVKTGRLLLVKGNHEAKQSRYLEKMAKRAIAGEDPYGVITDLEKMQGEAHGLTPSLREAHERGNVEEWRERAAAMARLPNHLSLDGGRLLVCHGAARKDLIGRDDPYDKEAESWFLYGAPTGARDERGFPIRADWQEEWEGGAFVVVGHSTVAEPRHRSNGGGSLNIDTGCAFGPNGVDVHTRQPFTGKLTAARWPEVTTDVEAALVSVPVDESDLA